MSGSEPNPRELQLWKDDLSWYDFLHDEPGPTSYHLHQELSAAYAWVREGGFVTVQEAAGPIIFSDVADFENWARARYPHADLKSSSD